MQDVIFSLMGTYGMPYHAARDVLIAALLGEQEALAAVYGTGTVHIFE